MPRLSVVILTLNEAHSIAATLASLARQDERDLEVIVVDAASADGTPAKVRQLAPALPFPLRLYWSTEDIVVGNQERDQTGKLFAAIERLAPNTKVAPIRGQWAHSHEFFPGKQLGAALMAFGLISQL